MNFLLVEKQRKNWMNKFLVEKEKKLNEFFNEGGQKTSLANFHV